MERKDKEYLTLIKTLKPNKNVIFSNSLEVTRPKNFELNNLDLSTLESRKVKFIKIQSENEYGEINPDVIELNNMMPPQANINLLYADVKINSKLIIYFKKANDFY